MSKIIFSAVTAMLFLGVASDGQAQSLRGSTPSLNKQNRVARDHDFTYIQTAAQVQRFVEAGYLVPVTSSRTHRLHDLSFPVARPEVALFISRLGQQYHTACGEQLVVTSLTRPKSHQPRNASPRSVHPTGMAIDLRRPNNMNCRRWLESVLLQLEGSGVLEATRESRPPHYHVALFPKQYAAYVERVLAGGTSNSVPLEYYVLEGDSLWEIAREYNTTVDRIRADNNLRGSRIYPGMVLTLSR